MTSASRWTTPVALDKKLHDREAFDCGNEILNSWVKRYAAQSQAADTSRVFVASPLVERRRIAGIYSLHLGVIERASATTRAGAGSPAALPAVVLGRMAVDLGFQGLGLGSALLVDVLRRTLLIAEHAAAKLLLVHAKDEAAKAFYLAHEFEPSPIDSLTLMLLVQDIRAAAGE